MQHKINKDDNVKMIKADEMKNQHQIKMYRY